jgi:hypothetical protein
VGRGTAPSSRRAQGFRRAGGARKSAAFAESIADDAVIDLAKYRDSAFARLACTDAQSERRRWRLEG